MKKTLIAVAALAATSAFAQNVTISGTVDATYRMSKTEAADGTSKNTTGIGKDGIGTTGFILSGNEDLGGGLKAVFLIENNFDVSDTANANSIANGQMFVGLEGAFGSVKLGAANSPTLTVQSGRAGSFGTKDGGRAALGAGGYSTLMGLSVTRNDGTIVYGSPNFAGFTVGLAYAPESDDGTLPAVGALTDLGLNYANGPLAAGVAIFNQDEAALVAKNELTSYFVTYDFKFAKFGLGGHGYKASAGGTTTIDNSGLNLLAEVPLSPALTLTANLQKLDDKSAVNADSSQTAVGVQYAMSKRTVAYARYIKQSADEQTGAAIKDASRTLVGLRHNF